MKYRLISSTYKDDHDIFITLKTLPNWLMRILGSKSREVTYYGNCTVWHSFPDCKRAGTSTEYMLSNFSEWVKEHNKIKENIDRGK